MAHEQCCGCIGWCGGPAAAVAVASSWQDVGPSVSAYTWVHLACWGDVSPVACGWRIPAHGRHVVSSLSCCCRQYSLGTNRRRSAPLMMTDCAWLFSSLVNKTKLTIPRPRPNVSDQDQDQDQCFTRPRPDQDQNFKTKTKTNCPVSQNPNIIHSSILVSKVILLNDWQRWRYVLNVIKSFKNLLYLTVRSTIYMTNGIQTVWMQQIFLITILLSSIR